VARLGGERVRRRFEEALGIRRGDWGETAAMNERMNGRTDERMRRRVMMTTEIHRMGAKNYQQGMMEQEISHPEMFHENVEPSRAKSLPRCATKFGSSWKLLCWGISAHGNGVHGDQWKVCIWRAFSGRRWLWTIARNHFGIFWRGNRGLAYFLHGRLFATKYRTHRIVSSGFRTRLISVARVDPKRVRIA